MTQEEVLQEEETLQQETEAEETAGTSEYVEETAEAEVETELEHAEEENDSVEGEGGESPISRKEKRKLKKEKKDKNEERIVELEDRVKRQMAEFDNFRKRTEKEKSHMYEIGARDVIEKILPVADNFERGLAAVPENEKENPVIAGMDKIYKQLMTTLIDLGVTPIEAVGKEFDPNFHNAVMHIEDAELGDNIIAEEFLKGYMYKENVIRYSMVKVAN